MNKNKGQACQCGNDVIDIESVQKNKLFGLYLKLIVLLAVWGVLYRSLVPISEWLTTRIFGLTIGSRIGSSVAFFLLDVPKVLMLLVLVVFGIGIIRSFFTTKRTRQLLVGKWEFTGNLLAASLGIVTPFCSCSACPLFIAFVEAGIPLGVTFSFLISAPMVNEVALVLLLGLFGWKVAGLYLLTGWSIAVIAGWVIGRLRMERYIEEWVLQIKMSDSGSDEPNLTIDGRIRYALQAVYDITGKVWPYVIAGIAVGAGIHGYVPEGLMASIMGKDVWWSVPAAVIVGIPMYSNAAGIIPVVQALMEKGAALGTVLAFMMSVIGLSLPETIILRRVLKWPLIMVFIGVVAAGILAIGYLFNAVL